MKEQELDEDVNPNYQLKIREKKKDKPKKSEKGLLSVDNRTLV